MKALKEWSAVIGALESGKQTVLLRKGGILEAASGFKVESKKFLLYPTAEHQGDTNIREEFHHLINRPRKLTSYAKVLAEADVDSKDIIDKLSKFHIWSEAYTDKRMMWQPEKPIKALFLKTYKIPEIVIPVKPEYKGCKSWIDTDTKIQDGTPVLNDNIIQSRLTEFEEIINEV